MPSPEPPPPPDQPAAVAPAVVPPAGPVLADGERARTVRLPGLSLVVRSRPADETADGPDRDVAGGASVDDAAGGTLADRAAAGRGGDAAGRGPEPALFVHGLGGSSQNWSALMAELAGTVGCEAVDLPGFGHSPPPDDGGYSVAAHARAVVRLLDAERRGPVHLFGNSMGGAIAVKVAAARPDLVRTLTLISPALPEVPPQRTAWPTALAALPGVPRLYRRATRDWSIERRTDALLALCYGDPSAVGERARAAAAAEYQRRFELPYFWDAMVRSTRGVVNAYTLGGQHALWRQAERVLAPTLLIYGGRDKLVAPASARRAALAFRDARTLMIPAGGHVAMMEHPRLVARAFHDLRYELARRDASAASAASPASAASAGSAVPGAAPGDAGRGGGTGPAVGADAAGTGTGADRRAGTAPGTGTGTCTGTDGGTGPGTGPEAGGRPDPTSASTTRG